MKKFSQKNDFTLYYNTDKMRCQVGLWEIFWTKFLKELQFFCLCASGQVYAQWSRIISS